MDFILGSGNFIVQIALLAACVIGGMALGSFVQDKLEKGTINDVPGGLIGGVLGLFVAYPILGHFIWFGP